MATMDNGDHGQGDPADPEHDLSFREADDYVERRRQKEILDAVQFVSTIQNGTESEYERGEIDLETRRAEVRMAVNSLIMETEQLIQKSGNKSLLEQQQIGTITLQPPADLVQFAQNSETKIWGDSSLAPKDVYIIQGVLGYLNAPATFSATWSIRADIPGEGPQEVPSSTTIRMPVETSMAVYRNIRHFLSQVDLDLGAQLEDYTGDEGPGL